MMQPIPAWILRVLGCCPGDLKHDPAAGFNFVNCEPHVEKDQQHDFNGGCYPRVTTADASARRTGAGAFRPWRRRGGKLPEEMTVDDLTGRLVAPSWWPTPAPEHSLWWRS